MYLKTIRHANWLPTVIRIKIPPFFFNLQTFLKNRPWHITQFSLFRMVIQKGGCFTSTANNNVQLTNLHNCSNIFDQ